MPLISSKKGAPERVSLFVRLVATVVATEKNITKSEKIILSKKLGKSPENRSFQGFLSPIGGDKRDRTADLLNAIQVETIENTGIFGLLVATW